MIKHKPDFRSSILWYFFEVFYEYGLTGGGKKAQKRKEKGRSSITVLLNKIATNLISFLYACCTTDC